MVLSFGLPNDFFHHRLLALFETMGSALTGRPIKLALTEHREGYDPSHFNACFTSRWADGPVVFTQSVDVADGNPRDGYPYLHSAELWLPGRRLHASDSGGSPFFARLELEVLPCSHLEAHTLRALLRRELGAEHDRCTKPWLTQDALDARVLELELLLKRVRHACAGMNVDPSREKAALEALIGKTRSEAPAALDAWVAKHDAFLSEPPTAEAQRARALWAELREGKRTFFDESARLPADRERYRLLFGIDP